MAIPIIFKKRAYASAPFHVHVKIQKIQEKINENYEIIYVTGSIERIFKKRLPIEIGDVVEFDIAVMKKNAPHPLDGGMFCCFEDLVNFGNVEVCLNGKPPFLSIADDLFEIIEKPTNRPAMVFPPADAELPRSDEGFFFENGV